MRMLGYWLLKLALLLACPVVVLFMYCVTLYGLCTGKLSDKCLDAWYVQLLGPLAAVSLFYYGLLKSKSLKTLKDDLYNAASEFGV